MKEVCQGCGTPLTDCGPVGMACLNKACTYEMDLAGRAYRAMKEARERAELARLKAKYEAEQ